MQRFLVCTLLFLHAAWATLAATAFFFLFFVLFIKDHTPFGPAGFAGETI
jgi:hypothetical protein